MRQSDKNHLSRRQQRAPLWQNSYILIKTKSYCWHLSSFSLTCRAQTCKCLGTQHNMVLSYKVSPKNLLFNNMLVLLFKAPVTCLGILRTREQNKSHEVLLTICRTLFETKDLKIKNNENNKKGKKKKKTENEILSNICPSNRTVAGGCARYCPWPSAQQVEKVTFIFILYPPPCETA